MKHLIFILTFFIFALPLKRLYSQVEYFNKIHMQNAASLAFGIVEKDSFYYTAGAFLDSATNLSQKLCFSKFAKNGDLLWAKSWGKAGEKFAPGYTNPLAKTYDSGFAIAGGVTDSVQNYSFLMKLDHNGDSVWTKYFFDTISPYIEDYLGFYSIKETSDKGFIIVGEIKGSHQFDSDIYLLKVDSLGNTEWYNTFGSYIIEKGFSIIQTPDTGYLIGGYRYKAGVDYTMNGILIKVNKNGNQQWVKHLGGQLDDHTALVTMSSDSNYLVVFSNAYYQPVPFNPSYKEIRVLKITPSEQILWDKTHRVATSVSVKNIFLLQDKRIVLTGVTFISDSINQCAGFEGFIMKLTENGDSVWYRNFNHQSYMVPGAENNLYDIKPTADGGFIACGSFINHFQPIHMSTWIIKTDSLGCDTPGCQYATMKKLEKSNNKLIIYPKPCKDNFTILYSLPTGRKKVVFTLYNSVGVKVKEMVLPSNTQQYNINTNSLTSGIYFGVLNVDGDVVGKAKVVVTRD